MKYILIFLLLFSNPMLLAAEEGHDEHEESSSNVGPEKGITEKHEEGMTLSSEAIKTMELETVTVVSQPIKVLNRAIVHIKSDKFVYRVRNNWFKRIEIEIVQKNNDDVVIRSSELSSGDKIVINGLGFLRTAEIYSEEGASHSH